MHENLPSGICQGSRFSVILVPTTADTSVKIHVHSHCGIVINNNATDGEYGGDDGDGCGNDANIMDVINNTNKK